VAVRQTASNFGLEVEPLAMDLRGSRGRAAGHGFARIKMLSFRECCHFERSEKPAFLLLPANSRFLVAALLGMTNYAMQITQWKNHAMKNYPSRKNYLLE
jgi:hypothetical protein